MKSHSLAATTPSVGLLWVTRLLMCNGEDAVTWSREEVRSVIGFLWAKNIFPCPDLTPGAVMRVAHQKTLTFHESLTL